MTRFQVVFGVLVLTGGMLLVTGAQALAQCEVAKLTASDPAAEDEFGLCVAVSGEWLVVGAPYDDDACLEDPACNSGSAYVFRRDDGGTPGDPGDDTWIWHQKLTAPDGEAGDCFGYSVSISGDYVLVSAPLDDDACPGDPDCNSGSAHIFRCDDNGTPTDLSDDVWIQDAKLTASDATAEDYFGISVSVSGDAAVVGAHGNDDAGPASGSAYVFEKPPGGWADMTETAKLLASDTAPPDAFGVRVAISGDVVVIGATANEDAGPRTGSAYVFKKPPGGWTSVPSPINDTAKLLASDGAEYDHFGEVSVSGDVVMVGAPYADASGLAHSGAVYVFVEPSDGWESGPRPMYEDVKLTASDAASPVYFGNSVSLSDNIAMIGAYSDLGGAYVFRFEGSSWVEKAKLTASDGAWNDYFGNSVSISGDTAVIGAPGDDDDIAGPDSGSAYVFRVLGLPDCNFNGVNDACELYGDDCNTNGIPDECDIFGGAERYAVARVGAGLYAFDPETGALTQVATLHPEVDGAYGLAFAPQVGGVPHPFQGWGTDWSGDSPSPRPIRCPTLREGGAPTRVGGTDKVSSETQRVEEETLSVANVDGPQHGQASSRQAGTSLVRATPGGASSSGPQPDGSTRPCPVGASENSPAIYRWDGEPREHQSPVGTDEIHDRLQSSLRDSRGTRDPVSPALKRWAILTPSLWDGGGLGAALSPAINRWAILTPSLRDEDEGGATRATGGARAGEAQPPSLLGHERLNNTS